MQEAFKKNMAVLIVPTIIVLAGFIGVKVGQTPKSINSGNVLSESKSEDENTQILDLTAKGGYSPKIINAKASINTILRVKTAGTFDCSTALVIPKLGIRKNLPPTATTEIAIAPQQAGTSLKGTCSMGMYNFLINFN